MLLCLLFFLGMGFGCQHARVQLAPQQTGCPDSVPADVSGCVLEAVTSKGSEKQLVQVFYLWGLYPRQIEYDGKELCPTGITEVHQFATFTDGLWTNLSLGIYTPRTLRVICAGAKS